MRTLSIVSQKGGGGKTTLAIHLAVEAERLGLASVIIDLDQQASSWKWSQRRKDNEPPEVITAVPEQTDMYKSRAEKGGVDLIIIDSAPHADRSAMQACRAADLVLVPTRASILDLDALKPVAELIELSRKEAFAVLNGVSLQTRSDTEEAKIAIVQRGFELYPGGIWDRVAFKRSLAKGLSVQEIGTDQKAIKEISDLFRFAASKLHLTIPGDTDEKAP